ncbi:unnamed protein product [Chrysoparadoxa australica]
MSKYCCGLLTGGEDDVDEAYPETDTAIPEPVPDPSGDVSAEGAKDVPTKMAIKAPEVVSAVTKKAEDLVEPEAEKAAEAVPVPVPSASIPASQPDLEEQTNVMTEVDIKPTSAAVEMAQETKAPAEGESGADESVKASTDAADKAAALEAFVAEFDEGFTLFKKNRRGKLAERVLFYDTPTGCISWKEVGKKGHMRRTSSMLKNIQDPLPVATLVEVQMAADLSAAERFCIATDTGKSFRLVFPARKVDLTATSEQEAVRITKGIRDLARRERNVL